MNINQQFWNLDRVSLKNFETNLKTMKEKEVVETIKLFGKNSISGRSSKEIHDRIEFVLLLGKISKEKSTGNANNKVDELVDKFNGKMDKVDETVKKLKDRISGLFVANKDSVGGVENVLEGREASRNINLCVGVVYAVAAFAFLALVPIGIALSMGWIATIIALGVVTSPVGVIAGGILGGGIILGGPMGVGLMAGTTMSFGSREFIDGYNADNADVEFLNTNKEDAPKVWANLGLSSAVRKESSYQLVKILRENKNLEKLIGELAGIKTKIEYNPLLERPYSTLDNTAQEINNVLNRIKTLKEKILSREDQKNTL